MPADRRGNGLKSRPERILGIDLLRVISVVAVVVGHSWPFMPDEEYLQIWRMPLFFFLSGYFLSPTRTFGAELGTRWRTLGVPYLVWLGLLITLVAAHHFTSRPFEGTRETILGALRGGGWTDMPFLALWFISVLFFAVLLVRALLRTPWWLQLSAAVAGLGIAQLPDSAMSYTVLGLGLVPGCAAFILAGYWFRRLTAKSGTGTLLSSRWSGPGGLALMTVGLGGVAAGAGSMNIKWSGFGTFLLSPVLAVLICIGLILIFGTWMDRLLRRFRPAAQLISALVATGTLVVFLHPYILFLIWDVVSAPPVRILIALIICWSLGVLVNRTRISPYLTGLPRAAKPSVASG